ncbi:GSCFA domain-containing protein [Mangrovimonas aestuarii]|uniref:GSCFA domain-containing protein n=1 Tax=Mangrovimonas aestuarii TaxID=3018443 RepID=UPI00237943DD|nr:GSCFA domain-containing protein [Mangrovimonas aestuarii]
MKLQTQVPIHPEKCNIDYNSKLLLMGSCFVDNIGEKLKYFKFQSEVNPFGVLFNPFAILRLFERAANKEVFTESDVFFHNEQWHCFEAHSKLSHSDKGIVVSGLNEALSILSKQLLEATHVVITLGTAWVYRKKSSQSVVANCHKVPQTQFTKELMSVENVAQITRDAVNLIQNLNPNVKVIYTVSPVRHIKDGMVENNRSKAHLISGIHSTLEHVENTFYFPSYEILMDELRDYRFYAEDMIHPNITAINYIWERFEKVWLDPTLEGTMKMVDTVQKGLKHKPFNPISEAHQRFLITLKYKQQQLQEKYPFMSF